jgi:RNA-binding protein
MKLTGKQRSYLRSLGQNIDPQVMIGKNGLSSELIKAVNEALDIHELVKIRFSDHKDERKDMTNELAQSVEADVAGIIGHTSLLYRQQKDPEKRKIRL